MSRSQSAQVLVLPRLFLGRAGTLRLLAMCARTGREMVSTRRGNIALVPLAQSPGLPRRIAAAEAAALRERSNA